MVTKNITRYSKRNQQNNRSQIWRAWYHTHVHHKSRKGWQGHILLIRDLGWRKLSIDGLWSKGKGSSCHLSPENQVQGPGAGQPSLAPDKSPRRRTKDYGHSLALDLSLDPWQWSQPSHIWHHLFHSDNCAAGTRLAES